MASKSGNFVWKKLGNEKRKRFRCMDCNNPLLTVIWEPVARQERSMTAHHYRVIAKCPLCKRHKRVTLGSPN